MKQHTESYSGTLLGIRGYNTIQSFGLRSVKERVTLKVMQSKSSFCLYVCILMSNSKYDSNRYNVLNLS